ncbi:MAG: hypothetical protein L0Y76_03270, partial [Ignavibacteria bacterium]|nr:hypothetical protein [Ignavibacteria bacterium]
HAFSLSIGRRLWDRLLIFEKTSLGFSINRHTFKTEAGDGAGIGFDVGLQTRFPYGFSFGFVARTLGTDMMGYKIDPELRFGIGYDVLIKKMHNIVVAVDGAYKMNRDYEKESSLEPARNNLKAFGGIEYSIIFKGLRISLSGGGNGMLHSSLGTYGFAGGLGIKYLGYCVQYAFQGDTDPDVSLGYEHRITLLLELKNLFPKKMKSEKVNNKKE